MIRKLVLRNWRNYENVTLEFGAGTTFVVASNGIGKTSLLEAARWALFGAAGDVSAIRLGAAAAVAEVTIDLPDSRVLSVERTLVGKGRRAIPPTVHLDGVQMDPPELSAHLAAAFGAEADFLARLSMSSVGEVGAGPSALKLEEHLGRYFGIDGLRNAVDHLTAAWKANQARIREVKSTDAAASRRLDQLLVEAEEAKDRAAAAEDVYRGLQARQGARRAWERFRQDHVEWQRVDAQARTARHELLARLTPDFRLDPMSTDVAQTLEDMLAEQRRRAEDTRVALALNTAEEKALIDNRERLGGAHGDCPVCRRPLDAETVAAADEASEREMAALRDLANDLSSAGQRLDEQLTRLERTLAEWRSIPDAGRPPQPPPGEDDPVDTERLDDLADEAMHDLVEARASQRRVEQERDEARAADEAMRRLEALFRREAALKVAIDTTESSLTELLDDTVRPLAAEVNQRWQMLFPDRGDLATRADGRVSRTVKGHSLPFGSFSTGESMTATILHRLLVTQMVTEVDFCWFDEPLEHLDPDTRRRVASLLSRVTRSDGPLKQVVITTYEEHLARRLRERDHDNVTLIDVRQSAM